jgi:hypothetical protein
MAWDDVKHFLGEALGDVSLFLRPASTWGTIPDVIAKRQEEVQKPGVAQSLVGSPFRAGLLGVGGKDVGGQFKPDIPPPANVVLHHVTDENGKVVPGAFVDPNSGKFFKGGWDLDEVMTKAKELGLTGPGGDYETGDVRVGPLTLHRKPGAMPAPPEGMTPAGARFDEKTNRWIPYYKTPGADKGPTAIPPDQLPFSTDETPPATPQGAKTTAPTTTTLPTRTNNPGDITASPATLGFPGVTGTVKGPTGLHFLQFDTPEHGAQAIGLELQRPLYRGLTFDKAMHKWSGGGYGAADVAPDIDPNQQIGTMTPEQLQQVGQGMARREGFQGGVQPVAARPGGSRLGPSGAPPEGAPPQAGAAAPKPSQEEWLRQHPGSSIEYGPHGVAHIRQAAPPAHRTDQERFFDEHPTATMQDWEDFLTANKGNQASARAEANALVKEKYKTFPAAAQATLSSIYAVRGLAAEMKAALADPAVAGNRGVFEGRMKNAITRWGFSQSSGEDVYQVLQREMGVIGIKPYLTGGRGAQRWIKELQTFMPAASDEGPLLNTKLDQILERSNELEKDVRNAAKERVNPELGAPGPEATPTTTAPPTTTTTLPAGDAQKAFDEHLNQYR